MTRIASAPTPPAPRRATASRRSFLLGLGAACPLCLSGLSAHAESTGHAAPHWGYEGEGAPESWGDLSGANKVCSMGMEQTPIDLVGATRASISPVDVGFAAAQATVVYNGHTIQVNVAGGGSVIEGTRYDLLQFHFHHPSEHLLAGRSFDLECHFVHKSASGALAVIGVFMRPGLENAALAPVWQAMPATAGGEAPLGTAFDPSGLLPVDRGFFRYMGSLTTPPCSEGLTWTVFKAPVDVSTSQIQQFASLFPMNARPIQPRHRRFLLESV
jgi:carbonic anhydrase